MSESIVTNDIASSVLDGIIGVNETRRNLDSSADEQRCFSLTPAQISMYKKSFSYNVGSVSDGKTIRLDETNIYFKIPVNISMINGQAYDDSSIYRSSERAASGNNIVQVFVDGLKIPDSEVLFYPTRTNVDIFVPILYINQTLGSDFIVEKKCFDTSTPYVRYYNKSTSSQLYNIPINTDILNNTVINERTLKIYVNKFLYTGTRSLTVSNNAISLTIAQQLSDAELEIIVDENIQYFIPGTMMSEGTKAIYEVPETYIDSIHGPLSKFSCMFYMNGKRIQNTKIKEVGRLHFEYDLPAKSSPVLSMYITDRALITDTDTILYGCDYYLYNMIGCSAITSALRTGVSGTIFDTHIDFNEVLNKNGDLFDRTKLNSMLNTYYGVKAPGSSSTDASIVLNSPSTKTAYLLENKPYLMRTFLENYGNQVYNYTVNYNGRDAYVYFGLPDTYELSSTRSYDISINTYHIPTDEISIISKDITDVFKIDAKYFNAGNNTVEVSVINQIDIEYASFTPADILDSDGFKYVDVKTFTHAKYANDIYVLEEINSSIDGNLNYPTSSNSGYKCISDATVEIDDDGVVHVLFTTIPTRNFIIYNSNFACTYKYTKPLASSTMDIAIPLYTGGDKNPIPYIPKGKVTVYSGNEKLIDGIDYFIKHPVNEETAAGSFIIIRRAILPGTNIDIYFSNMKTKKIINYPGYFTNNPYGLFYLGNLTYPVSLKYLNIYVNNRKVTDSDIDILSDKLIRIHSLATPMYDLSVESTFTVEDSELQPYINLYKEDAFEIYIASLFKGVYYNRPYDPNEKDVPDYNAIYETFVDSVDAVNKAKNPVAKDAEWIPADNKDTSKSGIYSDGTAMGGEDINCSFIAGGSVVFAGNKGRVCSCKINTLSWSNYDSAKAVSNNGSFVNGDDILSSAVYNDYCIFGTKHGKIGVYDISKNTWYTEGSNNCPINLNKVTSDIYPESAIYKILIDDDDKLVIILGENGNVATYSFTTDKWYSYTDKLTKNIAAVQGIMGNIYDAYIATVNSQTVIVVMGEKGKVASCKLASNAWTTPSGSRYLTYRAGPDIYSDGSFRDNADIYHCADYLNMKVLVGAGGRSSFYNVDSGKFVGSADSRNISNTGSHSGNKNTNYIINYESSILITGNDDGAISSYYGDIQNWRAYNSNTGITDTGTMMSGCDIRSIVYTFGETNYIVFSGEKGKVCMYNVDVHEVPYRYDPYKTAFLKWYTTPGNATVITEFNISNELAKKFSMYHDQDDDNYDVSVAAGDMDLISDIDMDDGGTYPRLLSSRARFLADFIQSLPDGRYTPDQVYALYNSCGAKNMLYDRDLIPLRGGDLLDQDDDIQIT